MWCCMPPTPGEGSTGTQMWSGTVSSVGKQSLCFWCSCRVQIMTTVFWGFLFESIRTFFFFCSGTQTMSFLPASVNSMVPKTVLTCGFCCLLPVPPLHPLHCSGSRPISRPAEGSWDGSLGTEQGCSPTGVQWVLAVGEGAAAHDRQDGAATMDLQFSLCSLIYELEM